ncbi:putative citrate transporter [Microlunatus phosphovorus NM-1]|uniref:Putative citrate transporter n=1 Tax=Microlunatus phosphovorus (strain ATCC 700054 / DSM 10555 / JCM 9379 / NBRC 101784 / NCIMB 13414 / VKM Ac-1990 / NM-1) TaxID=1032480 RepID=F5XMF9_MICPN|nr:citrate:proton symporter [Microlunatus phosphovorus]BAK36416.1 putative citrate transporter [Microlunatus phosphovorus NM-1]
MLAIWGLSIVVIFLVLIMSKKVTPFTSLVLTPVVIAIFAGFAAQIGVFALEGVQGVATTAIMLLFAILYFGLMLTAGLFDPLVHFILRVAKGDPLRVLVGTAILAAAISVDGDGSTTTMIVCSAMIPVYKKLGMKMMDLAVIIIMANSVMNLLPWGGPTARIIAALKVDEGELLRRLLPGMIIAILWVIVVAFLRGLSERKRLGIVELTPEEIKNLHVNEVTGGDHAEGDKLKRPKMIWANLALTSVVMILLVFGGMAFIPKLPAPIIFEVAFAIALLLNYPRLKDQRQIIEEHGANVMHVITMVLAAGVFMGILNGSGMSEAMGVWLADVVPSSMGNHWALVTALASAPGTFMLSNDAFYLGVLPVLAQTGANYGFTAMDIGVASTAGQAFHLLSPLVGFIYLLLHLTGVEMGAWQRTAAKWSIGTFIIFLVSMAVFGGVRL